MAGNYPINTLAELDRTTRYAMDVVDGRLPRRVGKSERLACERHIRDLERQGTPEFPYVWDQERAQELIDFAESLTLAEGEEPRPLELWGFQDFIFGSWHGWRTPAGYRRFRTSYVQVARQNGKSLGNAVPTLYYGNFDGYQYPQVYRTATKEAQARIVLKECFKFIEADPELGGSEYEEGLFTIKDYASKILCSVSRGEVRALGRDTKSIDGFRPYFGSVDEYHLHKDNGFVGGHKRFMLFEYSVDALECIKQKAPSVLHYGAYLPMLSDLPFILSYIGGLWKMMYDIVWR